MSCTARRAFALSSLSLLFAVPIPAVQAGSIVAVPATAVAASRPKIRWWWPDAEVQPAELDRELRSLKAAGFGGVEISSLPQQLTVDPQRYGWGSQAWDQAVQHTLETAARLGLQVDLTIGPAWPSVVPGISPDSAAAEKELVYGYRIVYGGDRFDGPAPRPIAPYPDGVKRRDLVALIAYECGRACDLSTKHPQMIDPRNAVDLTDAVKGGRASWNVPGKSAWVLLAFWQQGAGQRVNMRAFAAPGEPDVTSLPAYVVDHYSAAGTQAVIDYWNANILTPPIMALLRREAGSIFEDSLELQADPLWTQDLAGEFERRRGYALRRWLPVLFLSDEQPLPPLPKTSSLSVAQGGHRAPPPLLARRPAPPFTVSDDDKASVLHDYYQTLSELYIERRVSRLSAWAHGLGLTFRNQAYGPPIDSAAATAATDIPEGESLGFDNRADSFRLLAAGREMAGLPILSDECCAILDSGYATTWQGMLRIIDHEFTGGVNQVVIHGFPYADDRVSAQAGWPGWAPMVPFYWLGTGFADAWGPRMPTWAAVRPIMDYLARTQAVLRAGHPRIDLAVYRLAYGTDGSFLKDPALSRAGYTYEYLSPPLLGLPSAVVRDHLLNPLGPAYKALILNHARALPLAAARRLLRFAQQGLPVFVVGTTPATVPGLSAPRSQQVLLRTVANLLRQPSVRRVRDDAALLRVLRAQGILPDAQHRPSGLRSVHRQDGAQDYYWLYDDSPEPVDQAVDFAAEGPPTQLDPWTGVTRAVAFSVAEPGRTSVPIRLLAHGATVIVFRKNQPAIPHVESTRVEAVPKPIDLTRAHWSLSVQDWRPGTTPTRTRKIVRTLELKGLRSWSEIPTLRDSSGTGVYTTHVNLASVPAAGVGYHLDLGEVCDTAIVRINGVVVPTDQITHRADVGADLRAGRNTISVEVATPLLNRMRVVRPDPFSRAPRQAYGLVGPVRLVPYAERVIGPG
jgi:hypothetical protein